VGGFVVLFILEWLSEKLVAAATPRLKPAKQPKHHILLQRSDDALVATPAACSNVNVAILAVTLGLYRKRPVGPNALNETKKLGNVAVVADGPFGYGFKCFFGWVAVWV